MKHVPIYVSLACLILFSSFELKKEKTSVNANHERAQVALESLYAKYAVQGTNLLRENYPFDDKYTATYLASDDQAVPNQYSYLWPYSGTFSAVNAILEATDNDKYKEILDTKVLPGLEEYFDQKRDPSGYASYINSAPESDRFYDDNVWLGIDFTDTYMMKGEQKYLDKAKLIWDFVASGMDDKLGGGIYWCEQKRESKNTCSNAPGAVFALKLFAATKDRAYLYSGKDLYEWTQKNLQDPTDNLYFDNIRLDGKIGKAKFAYNSGQMMQAAVLLYKATGEDKYLTDAQNLATACYNYFFHDFKGAKGEQFCLLNKGNIWFTAVMLRGFIELYNVDHNPIYINAFKKNMDYAWEHSRDENGLFSTDWSGQQKDASIWLLTQAAMVEMYGRLATVK
ncbi:glycoside hydrolase family 76 protein [Dysgonomonas sp. ZJ709]|uniref:glycoside hydrolase family 76 protein n=1 Tax=Dysgonomonas sp. ZJ709 TaxID=2709797 RepID=UPI0013E9DDA0|nr:glycoside hydrolase family 76 protein [Dysgonomonas sp. ZJ709]